LCLADRGDDAVGAMLALAFRQCRFAAVLAVSELADGVGAGAGSAAGMTIEGSAGATGRSSLSDFAASFAANAGSNLL